MKKIILALVSAAMCVVCSACGLVDEYSSQIASELYDAVGEITNGISENQDGAEQDLMDQDQISDGVNDENIEEHEYVYYTINFLLSEMQSNPLRAKTNFCDQYVVTTGKLGNIDSDGKYFDVSSHYEMDLFNFDSVTCYITDKSQLYDLMELNSGSIITIWGKITEVGEVLGYSMDVDKIDANYGDVLDCIGKKEAEILKKHKFMENNEFNPDTVELLGFDFAYYSDLFGSSNPTIAWNGLDGNVAAVTIAIQMEGGVKETVYDRYYTAIEGLMALGGKWTYFGLEGSEYDLYQSIEETYDSSGYLSCELKLDKYFGWVFFATEMNEIHITICTEEGKNILAEKRLYM